MGGKVGVASVSKSLGFNFDSRSFFSFYDYENWRCLRRPVSTNLSRSVSLADWQWSLISAIRNVLKSSVRLIPSSSIFTNFAALAYLFCIPEFRMILFKWNSWSKVSPTANLALGPAMYLDAKTPVIWTSVMKTMQMRMRIKMRKESFRRAFL